MTIVEIVKAVKAIDYTSANRFAEVESVSFNSQLCQKNSLFVPLKGTTDGHNYVQHACEQGATVTFWDRPQDEAPDNIACIFVDDTLQALQDLATYYLKTTNPKVVAITGSNGKTTTKDMVESVLAKQYRTYKTQGNYNNDIGVPMTILGMPETTEILVLEMGMDDFGQIEKLSCLANPDVAVITLIGDSHLEALGSREGIAKAKLEIVSGLVENGVLIVPNEEPLLAKDVPHIHKQTFGKDVSATMQLIDVETNAHKTIFKVAQSEHVFTLPIIGAYNAYNAMIALLVGRHFNVSDKDMQEALAYFTLTANRLEWVKGINNSRLLNDAYNASPTSMKAIIKDFQEIETKHRKYLVLGDMKELGKDSQALHESIVDSIDCTRLAGIYLYGENMLSLYHVLLKQHDCPVWHELDDKSRLSDMLRHVLQQDDLVLIKSSYGTRLLDLVNDLREKHEQ
ncbi:MULTISPECIES: UDP-N-acetylmuramoyl-tripeptide--D-alanyl-D-alanine ligase [unclassified Granulicatella]|uniref:UDP-N-acetylmuramoyl-tripeptide--D-alanyl-D- alanine ligase n=1 Tax=unclassified Granulicatella TaxID=2630493 RepID=UPI001D165C98|nr:MULTISPECIES: UDP-N-acetylmuramoyl-tripeptide--D-alanyl-D-alanine ligase [unclassified Granulicatella]